MLNRLAQGNVPLCDECQGRGAMPPGPGTRDGAPEAEAPLRLWVAIWLCSVVYHHRDFELWVVVQEMLPKGSYQGECRVRVAD